MVRLVFRPYTHVRRTICTSVSLRTSTKISPGFILHKHSSPSFGSQHTCSSEECITRRITNCWSCHKCVWFNRFLYAQEFTTRILAHTLDSLVRVSRRVGWQHHNNVKQHKGSRREQTADTFTVARDKESRITTYNQKVQANPLQSVRVEDVHIAVKRNPYQTESTR